MTRRKKIALGLFLALLIAGLGLGWWLNRPDPPPDSRFQGLFRLDDGRLAILSPRPGNAYRLLLPDSGEARSLWPVEEARFEVGSGFRSRQPVTGLLSFTVEDGRGTSFQRVSTTGERWSARRQPLAEEIFTFPAGDLRLRGKLVLPPGPGPFPAAVLVHGSERFSAVDYYSDPYWLAAAGFATLVYDKRGTGRSEGEYTQLFETLAQDTLAAVRWLEGRREIDSARINLVGFSQGGWIAPLAAEKHGGLRAVAVGFGTVLPVTAEDRWGYVYALQREGFGPEAIAQADEVNAIIGRIADHGENRWQELARLKKQVRDAPWAAAVRGSDSALGFLLESSWPMWILKPLITNFSPPIDRLWDPRPMLASSETPMLWVLGGKDSSLPTAATVDALEILRDHHDRSIDIVVYPEAEHGILRFTEEPSGERELVGYEPDYFPTLARWLRRQNGLGEGTWEIAENGGSRGRPRSSDPAQSGGA